MYFYIIVVELQKFRWLLNFLGHEISCISNARISTSIKTTMTEIDTYSEDTFNHRGILSFLKFYYS